MTILIKDPYLQVLRYLDILILKHIFVIIKSLLINIRTCIKLLIVVPTIMTSCELLDSHLHSKKLVLSNHHFRKWLV